MPRSVHPRSDNYKRVGGQQQARREGLALLLCDDHVADTIEHYYRGPHLLPSLGYSCL